MRCNAVEALGESNPGPTHYGCRPASVALRARRTSALTSAAPTEEPVSRLLAWLLGGSAQTLVWASMEKGQSAAVQLFSVAR